MGDFRIRDVEHGVVIPCGTRQRIPAAAAFARASGRRGMHYGWPGMTRTGDGAILVGASERVHHICPFGREVVARSEDGGRTWTEPQVIFDSVTDDRDIALNTLGDGTVVATWFSSSAWYEAEPRPEWREMPEWRAVVGRVTPDTLKALRRGWLRRSPDGGRTWEEKVYPTIVGQHAGPTPLADGGLIYLGPYGDGQNGNVMAATRSEDGGRTWRIVGRVPGAPESETAAGRCAFALNENHVLETSPGRLLAAFRAHPLLAPDAPRLGFSVHTLHFSRSEDGGRTWSVPENSGIAGFPPYLLRLASGALLCVLADRDQPRTVRAVFSADEGLTWDAGGIQTLRQFDYPADMGYPVAVETAPGEVFCIYYAIPTISRDGEYEKLEMDRWGILSTRFRV